MTGDPCKPLIVFPIQRAVPVLALFVAAVAFAVYFGLNALAQPAHARLNLIAALICGGAGVVGLLPVWVLSKQQPHGAAYGFMAGILFRMFVAGGAVVLAQWVLKLPDARPLSMWIAGWYLIVLVMEVRLVSAHVLAAYPGSRKQPVAPHAGVTLKSES